MTRTDKFMRWVVASHAFLANEDRLDRLEQDLLTARSARTELQRKALELYEPGFEHYDHEIP